MTRKSSSDNNQDIVIIPNAVVDVEFTTKNLRSKIPRRKRSRFSPILLTSSPNRAHNNNNKKNKIDDNNNLDVSCNTTLDNSVVLPESAASHVLKTVVFTKTAAKSSQQQVSTSENYSCVESCSVIVEKEVVSYSDTVDQKTGENFNFSGEDDDLACDESLSSDDYEVTSAAEIFSSSNNEEYCGNSQFDDYIDEYTPSIWLNSGSEFSEKSYDDDSAPSPCFSLFKEFKQQFLYLNSDYTHDNQSDRYAEELLYWTFEDVENEESYKLLRCRERNPAVKVTNYVEEYQNETVFGEIIAEQRLVMVNWIVEISRKKELESETMFLGVRLFDRFLSKGCFASKRNLQILGIACLTLAIRIEQNQPYNSVRQKSFYVGSNIYSKTEIVAMEWVVQEVLKFHCISTTIHNFLWFYLKAADANEQMRKKAEYLAGLTLLDNTQLRFWPSAVAAALVILVSLSAERDESCQRVMEVHVRTKTDDLPECIKSLEWLVKHAL